MVNCKRIQINRDQARGVFRGEAKGTLPPSIWAECNAHPQTGVYIVYFYHSPPPLVRFSCVLT